MSTADILTVVSLVLGILAILGVAYTAGVKITRIETKVDVLWNAELEFSRTQARKRGQIMAESPDAVSKEIADKYGLDLVMMRQYIKQHKNGCSDVAIAVALLKEFQNTIYTMAKSEDMWIAQAVAICVTAVKQTAPIQTLDA